MARPAVRPDASPLASSLIVRSSRRRRRYRTSDDHASRPEHLTALNDEFLPVGPADEEEDGTVYGQRGVMPGDEGDELDEWFAFLAMDPAEDDDWLWSA